MEARFKRTSRQSSAALSIMRYSGRINTPTFSGIFQLAVLLKVPYNAKISHFYELV